MRTSAPSSLLRAASAASTPALLRRDLLLTSLLVPGALLAPRRAAAADIIVAGPEMQQIAEAGFAYRLTLPQIWEAKPKPVKTHQHEALFAAPGGGGLKAGITVDPVKIKTLQEFGTPEQVAERIITVEQGRDGVKTVTLRQVAADPGPPSYYTVEYLTESSRCAHACLDPAPGRPPPEDHHCPARRGIKVFRCKYCITARGLYVLQAQANADAFDGPDARVRETIRSIVDSFEVAA